VTPRTDLTYSALCGEGVVRRGEFQPCDKPTVAFRIDPTEGIPYVVCAYHCRADMVPLIDVLEAASSGVSR
jgi:hypothetical protein